MTLDVNLHGGKMALDEEQSFRARARAVRQTGLWAAGRLGLSGSEAESFAHSLVATDFDEPGDEDVIRRLCRDLEAVGTGEQVIRAELARQLAQALGSP